MQIDPKVSMIFNIVIAIIGAIALAGVSIFNGLVPDAVAREIVGWCSLIITIYGSVNASLHGFSAPIQGPLVKPPVNIIKQGSKIALLLAAGAFAALACDPHMAFAAPAKPIVLHHVHHGVARHVVRRPKARGKMKLSLNLNELQQQLLAVSLADLQAAEADATAQKDTVASGCYGDLIALVQAQQTAASATLPTPHLVTDFQHIRDFAQALQPNSALSVACAPLANQVQMNVLNLIAGITAGSLSLSSFGL